MLADRPGPRGPHKLTEEVMSHLDAMLLEEVPIGAAAMVERLRHEQGVSVHRRTIEKLMRRKKGG